MNGLLFLGIGILLLVVIRVITKGEGGCSINLGGAILGIIVGIIVVILLIIALANLGPIFGMT